MKKNIASILLIIVLVIIALALKSVADVMKEGRSQQTPTPTASPTDIPEDRVRAPEAPIEPTGKVSGKAVDFAHVGKITFGTTGFPEAGGPWGGTILLSYLEGNVRPATTTLTFDELSSCAAPNGSQPCMEFNVPLDVPYNNQDVVIEGIRQAGEGGYVLVRKMMIQDPNDHDHIPKVGRIFISWPQAINFINSCGPKMILQTHDLDVSLRFDDGTTLVAVEPVIDEVMRVAEGARAQCGMVPIATE